MQRPKIAKNLEKEEQSWKAHTPLMSRIPTKLQELRESGSGIEIDKYKMPQDQETYDNFT